MIFSEATIGQKNAKEVSLNFIESLNFQYVYVNTQDGSTNMHTYACVVRFCSFVYLHFSGRMTSDLNIDYIICDKQ